MITTNQNHGNIQKAFEALVPQILDRSEEEIRLLLEMLVRAGGPVCFLLDPLGLRTGMKASASAETGHSKKSVAIAGKYNLM